ncbi:MAG TPA: hypothetical protein PL124_12390 [Candidatus Cloacimonadota bacterium]|nr:hypothetical protein [Candidatus Cloacimonadota bacterium]HPS40209.1 hypothetical protein [Candidatus Cloacimonadota bacterium]
MNMLDMVMALMAVVFFTTISLMYNQAMWTQADNLNDATLVVQASQIGHMVLDEVDAKLFSKQLAFANISSSYNFTRNTFYPHLKVTFNIKSVAADCDSLGNNLPQPVTNNIYKRVTVTISGPQGLRHPVTMRRLYTKTNLNI